MPGPTDNDENSFGAAAYSSARAIESLVGVGSTFVSSARADGRTAISLLNKILVALTAMKVMSVGFGGGASAGTPKPQAPRATGQADGGGQSARPRGPYVYGKNEGTAVRVRLADTVRIVQGGQTGRQLRQQRENRIREDAKRREAEAYARLEAQRPMSRAASSTSKLRESLGIESLPLLAERRKEAEQARRHYSEQSAKKYDPNIRRLGGWISGLDSRIAEKEGEIAQADAIINSRHRYKSTHKTRTLVRDQERRKEALGEQIGAIRESRGIFSDEQERLEEEKWRLQRRAQLADERYAASVDGVRRTRDNTRAMDSMRSLRGMSFLDGGNAIKAMNRTQAGLNERAQGTGFMATYRRLREKQNAIGQIDTTKTLFNLQRVFRDEERNLRDKYTRGDIDRKTYNASKDSLISKYKDTKGLILSQRQEKGIETFAKAVKDFGGKQLQQFSASAKNLRVRGWSGLQKAAAGIGSGIGKAASWTFGGGLSAFAGGPWGMAIKAAVAGVLGGLQIRNALAKDVIEGRADAGRKGNLIRSSGASTSDVARAMTTGRRNGVSDDSVLNMAVRMQQNTLGALFGRGNENQKLGQWGLSVYNENGGLKNFHQRMIDASQKLAELEKQYGKNSDMSRLFLQDVGYSPDQADFVREYARNAKKRDISGENLTEDVIGANTRDLKFSRYVEEEKQRYQDEIKALRKQGKFEAAKAKALEFKNNLAGLEVEWEENAEKRLQKEESLLTALTGDDESSRKARSDIRWGKRHTTEYSYNGPGIGGGASVVHVTYDADQEGEEAIFGKKKDGESRLSDLLDLTKEGREALKNESQGDLLSNLVNKYASKYGEKIEADDLRDFRLNTKAVEGLGPEGLTQARLLDEIYRWKNGLKSELGITAGGVEDASLPTSEPVVSASKTASVPASQPTAMQDRSAEAVAKMEAVTNQATEAAQSGMDNGGSQGAMMASAQVPNIEIQMNLGNNTFNGGDAKENEQALQNVADSSLDEIKTILTSALKNRTAIC